MQQPNEKHNNNREDLSLFTEEKLEEEDSEVWTEHSTEPSNDVPREAISPQASEPKASTSSVDLSQYTDDELFRIVASWSSETFYEKKRRLQAWAYKLGQDEAREMQRGRVLNILAPKSNGDKS